MPRPRREAGELRLSSPRSSSPSLLSIVDIVIINPLPSDAQAYLLIRVLSSAFRRGTSHQDKHTALIASACTQITVTLLLHILAIQTKHRVSI
jgi:hypothetical protein